jgi:hypothetical protein
MSACRVIWLIFCGVLGVVGAVAAFSWSVSAMILLLICAAATGACAAGGPLRWRPVRNIGTETYGKDVGGPGSREGLRRWLRSWRTFPFRGSRFAMAVSGLVRAVGRP